MEKKMNRIKQKSCTSTTFWLSSILGSIPPFNGSTIKGGIEVVLQMASHLIIQNTCNCCKAVAKMYLKSCNVAALRKYRKLFH